MGRRDSLCREQVKRFPVCVFRMLGVVERGRNGTQDFVCVCVRVRVCVRERDREMGNLNKYHCVYDWYCILESKSLSHNGKTVTRIDFPGTFFCFCFWMGESLHN